MMSHPPIDLVITNDIVSFLAATVTEDFLQASIPSIHALISEFLSNLEHHLPPNYRLSVFDVTHLATQLYMETRKTNFPIVSLDKINIPWAQHYCHATTLIRENGDICWVSKSETDLHQEVASLRSLGQIALVDIGAQSGSLVSWCVSNLLVGESYLGVCSEPSRIRLEKAGVPVRPLHHFQQLQWVELKDLLGIDGRRCVIEGRLMKLPAIITFIENAHVSAADRQILRNLCLKVRAELVDILVSQKYVTRQFDDVVLSLD